MLEPQPRSLPERHLVPNVEGQGPLFHIQSIKKDVGVNEGTCRNLNAPFIMRESLDTCPLPGERVEGFISITHAQKRDTLKKYFSDNTKKCLQCNSIVDHVIGWCKSSRQCFPATLLSLNDVSPVMQHRGSWVTLVTKYGHDHIWSIILTVIPCYLFTGAVKLARWTGQIGTICQTVNGLNLVQTYIHSGNFLSFRNIPQR